MYLILTYIAKVYSESKKQHSCVSSGLCDHYSEFFTHKVALIKVCKSYSKAAIRAI